MPAAYVNNDEVPYDVCPTQGWVRVKVNVRRIARLTYGCSYKNDPTTYETTRNIIRFGTLVDLAHRKPWQADRPWLILRNKPLKEAEAHVCRQLLEFSR